MSDSKKGELLRKLLALANHPSTPRHEADAARRMAERLGHTDSGPADQLEAAHFLSWHDKQSPSEPACGVGQWRTKDRTVVVRMSDMHPRHLGHCIRFARTRTQHANKLAELLREEASRRGIGHTLRLDGAA